MITLIYTPNSTQLEADTAFAKIFPLDPCKGTTLGALRRQPTLVKTPAGALDRSCQHLLLSNAYFRENILTELRASISMRVQDGRVLAILGTLGMWYGECKAYETACPSALSFD